ncbi:MAG TPA: 2OG-Fe(II) oxygenase [Polyangia bacterium]|nr:2OG-Fe(II) oxygenase [Polyangia bacterium]
MTEKAQEPELDAAEVVALGEQGFFVRDRWLGAHVAARVHAEIEELAKAGRLHRAGLSRGAQHRLDPSQRGDEVAWIEPHGQAASSALSALCERFELLRRALNRTAWLGLDRFDVQAARYPGGGTHYARHRDAFSDRPSRRVTAIYYANPGWGAAAGGLLRLHSTDRPTDIAPQDDRLVVFLSERIEHEVTPAQAPRIAVTAWYYGATAPR